MLKKPAKAINFYSDTHDNTPLIKGGIRGGVHFTERLAGQADGL
jgi:hypothetical protein